MVLWACSLKTGKFCHFTVTIRFVGFSILSSVTVSIRVSTRIRVSFVLTTGWDSTAQHGVSGVTYISTKMLLQSMVYALDFTNVFIPTAVSSLDGLHSEVIVPSCTYTCGVYHDVTGRTTGRHSRYTTTTTRIFIQCATSTGRRIVSTSTCVHSHFCRVRLQILVDVPPDLRWQTEVLTIWADKS